jgi:hypothetical protein
VFAILDELQGAGHCPNWSQYRQRTIDQSKHFLYYLMDLGKPPAEGHANPQPPAHSCGA